MNTQQQRNLQKIMAGFDSDYRIAEVLHARQVELQETLKTEYLLPAFDNLRRAGVRQDVINAALESVEFEESLAAFISELTGIHTFRTEYCRRGADGSARLRSDCDVVAHTYRSCLRAHSGRLIISTPPHSSDRRHW